MDMIERLANQFALRQKMSQNARMIFEEKFEADVIYDQFAAHVEQVAETKGDS